MRTTIASATLIGLVLPSLLFAQTARTMLVKVALIDPEATLTRAVNVATGEKATDFGDIVVPIKRKVQRTRGVLKAALTELFSFHESFIGQSGLYTALADNDIVIANSTTVRDGTAYIDLDGRLAMGGIGYVARYDEQVVETVKANAKGIRTVHVTLNGKRSEWLAFADARGREDQREWPVLDDTFAALRANKGLSGFRFVLSVLDTPPTIVNDEATITFNGWFIRTKGKGKLNIDTFLGGIANQLKQTHRLTSVTFMFNGQPKTY